MGNLHTVDAARLVGPKLKSAGALASESVVAGVTSVIANGLENESDKEPSKSVSALLEVTGSADQRGTKAMSFEI